MVDAKITRRKTSPKYSPWTFLRIVEFTGWGHNQRMSWSRETLGKAVVAESGGFRLVGTSLWLDATRPRELGVITHAHRDHVARHSRILATAGTLSLLGLAEKTGAIPCRYRNPVAIGQARIELLPSGHLFGGAQVLLEWKGARILYTGDIYDDQQRFADPMVPTTCDLLVLEATYGTPDHRFPSREVAAAMLREKVAQTIDKGGCPLVLVEGSLGRAQEVLAELAVDGHQLVVSKSIARWNRALEKCGVAVVDCMPYGGHPPRGAVLVYPTRSRGLSGLNRLKGLVKIACSGQPQRSARRLGVDVIVPFVDHADFDGLIRIARQSGARKILTTHGHAETLSAELQARGLDAEPIPEAPQLSLEL